MLHSCWIPDDDGSYWPVACCCGVGIDHPAFTYRVLFTLGEEEPG